MIRMIATLLFALMAIPAVAQETSLEQEAQAVLSAERAFDAAATRDGQWTAFRAYAAADATMFAPGPVNAQTWLAGRADPPRAVRWQPHEIFISCDATLAATTGAWQRADGTVGYFTTVWRKQADGTWKWLLDHGDALTVAREAPETPIVHVVDCSRPRSRMGIVVDEGTRVETYYADDNSLWVTWTITPDGVRRVWVGERVGVWVRDDIRDIVPAP